MSPPEPIDGQVIGCSRSKAILFCALACGLFLMGAGLVSLWTYSNLIAPDPSKKPMRVTYLLSGVVIAVGACVWLSRLIRPILSNSRIVIGTDRLQLIEGRNGSDLVVAQIPFSNLAQVKYVAGGVGRVGIKLHDTEEPETYPPRKSIPAVNQWADWDFSIPTGYQLDSEALARVINDAVDKWDISTPDKP